MEMYFSQDLINILIFLSSLVHVYVYGMNNSHPLQHKYCDEPVAFYLIKLHVTLSVFILDPLH